jgi:hypothetical protein
MTEKLYSINEASTIFSIPRSVLMNGVLNEAIETTLKFDTASSRCRSKHFVTEKVAKAFYQDYLEAQAAKPTDEEAAARRKYANTTDTYNLTARHRLEDLKLLKELAGYGVCAEDLM